MGFVWVVELEYAAGILAMSGAVDRVLFLAVVLEV